MQHVTDVNEMKIRREPDAHTHRAVDPRRGGVSGHPKGMEHVTDVNEMKIRHTHRAVDPRGKEGSTLECRKRGRVPAARRGHQHDPASGSA